MLVRLHNWIIRQIYYRHINIFGWPTRRQRAVWWLYEWKYLEMWRDVAKKMQNFHTAVRVWIDALDES